MKLSEIILKIVLKKALRTANFSKVEEINTPYIYLSFLVNASLDSIYFQMSLLWLLKPHILTMRIDSELLQILLIIYLLLVQQRHIYVARFHRLVYVIKTYFLL